MRKNINPWRWPIAMGVAAALLAAVVFVIPAQWFAFLLNINPPKAAGFSEPPAAWLVLHPPPELLVIAEPEIDLPENLPPKELAPFQPEGWWNKSTAISVVAKESRPGMRVSHQDSARYFLKRLGISEDFMTRSQPDSLLAAKIFFLQLEDSYDISHAKAYLSAMGRAKDYEDIMSRAAAMFNEFLETNIMVPD